MIVIYSLVVVKRLKKRYSSACKPWNSLLKIVFFLPVTADHQYKEECNRDGFYLP